MKRRAFLRLGALGPAMLALGSAPQVRPQALEGAKEVPRGDAATVLDADHRAILMAVVERVTDTGEPGAPSAREVGTLERIERLLSVLEPEVVSGLELALRAIDLWPTVMELRMRRFRSLSDLEKDQSLTGWRSSRIELRRQVFYGLRQLAIFGYWSDERTWPLVGYPGPWIRRPE